MFHLRKEYHREVCSKIIRIQKRGDIEFPNFADGSNTNSRNIAWKIVDLIGCSKDYTILSGQTTGFLFEEVTKDYLQKAFGLLSHLRPGKWIYSTHTSISEFEQYEHIAYLERIIQKDKELGSILRGGYLITPDILIGREPVSDNEINEPKKIIEQEDPIANLTPLRSLNRHPSMKILHASISCKWTIRSDRAQNTRTEAINLIRNRKGHLPHLVVVTAEPTPHRLASLALGTGDLDCVYHFALYELVDSIRHLALDDAFEEVMMMIDGKRLRDISDLPFDLAI